MEIDVYVLQVLKKYASAENPLTQQDIIDYLKSDFNIVRERKAVGKKLKELNSSGYEIMHKHGRGYWIDGRDFEECELQILIDTVLASKNIPAKDSKKLIEKLCNEANIDFKSCVDFGVENIDKAESKELFWNIENVRNAIKEDKKITFDYMKYKADKKRYPTGHEHIVSPYKMIIHNQLYYLVGYNETADGKNKGMRNFRLDKIANIKTLGCTRKPLQDVPGYEKGINMRQISNTPYMYSDKPQKVGFITNEYTLDAVFDWFGRSNITIAPIEGSPDKYYVSLSTSLKSMKYWALQYMDDVEVRAPKSLRDEIKETIKKAQEKYKD